MSGRIFIAETDLIRITEDRRARRYERALIGALLFIFALFILERLV